MYVLKINCILMVNDRAKNIYDKHMEHCLWHKLTLYLIVKTSKKK